MSKPVLRHCLVMFCCSDLSKGLLRALRSKYHLKNFGSVEIRTRGCWARSANATSVLCSPQRHCVLHEKPISSKFCRKPQSANPSVGDLERPGKIFPLMNRSKQEGVDIERNLKKRHFCVLMVGCRKKCRKVFLSSFFYAHRIFRSIFSHIFR